MAEARGCDLQIVLPGHCLKAIVNEAVSSLADLSKVDGIGAFRVARDGEAILAAAAGREVPDGEPG